MKTKFFSYVTLWSVSLSLNAASVNFSSGASVLNAISITKNADLNFGSFIPGTVGNSFVNYSVSSAGVEVISQSNATIAKLGGAASFTVTGSPNTSYSISLPANASITNGANSLTIEFTTSQLQGGSLSRTLNASGTDTFKCGGIVRSTPLSVQGSYTGSFSMVVNY